MILILACAALVRLVGLVHHATMPDEAFTFFIAAHSPAGIVDLLKSGDFHPPLIYLIGHALFALTSKAYLFRIVSAVFGILGVATTYAVARRALGDRGAWLAAFLVAVNPALVFYDGFFRMYALLWSLCMASWALMLWALDRPRSLQRWAAYSVCLVALLYTQYLAFFTLAAQAAYVWLFKRHVRGFWIAVAASLCAFAPWLPVLLVQYPLGGTAYNALHGHWLEMLQAPPVLLVDGLPPLLELSPVTIAVLWICIAAGAALAVAQRRWVALAIATPLVLQVLYSLASGKLLLGQRYLLQAIPALIILVVLVIQTLAVTRARALGVALAAASALLATAGTIDKHFLAPYMPIDWTEYRRFLEARVHPGDAIIFDGSLVYYVLVGSPVASGRPLFLVADSHDAAASGALAAKMPRVWLVDYQSELPDPNGLAYAAVARTHPQHVTWKSTAAGYGDVVLTTLFLPPGAKRGP